jgi:hypothetical protein
MMTTYTVKGTACAGQAPALEQQVATLDAAASAVRTWITTHGLGASECRWHGTSKDPRWPGAPCGVGVVTDGGQTVAYVAFNGRVLDADGLPLVADEGGAR